MVSWKPPTNFLQMFPKPDQTHENGESVDKSQVGQDGNEVDVKLLVGVQILNIDTEDARDQRRLVQGTPVVASAVANKRILTY